MDLGSRTPFWRASFRVSSLFVTGSITVFVAWWYKPFLMASARVLGLSTAKSPTGSICPVSEFMILAPGASKMPSSKASLSVILSPVAGSKM